eukprot:2557103-Pleurochrysis_carterae.AAC.1
MRNIWEGRKRLAEARVRVVAASAACANGLSPRRHRRRRRLHLVMWVRRAPDAERHHLVGEALPEL